MEAQAIGIVRPLGQDSSYKGGSYGTVPAAVAHFESGYEALTGAFTVADGSKSYGPVELEVGRLWYALTMLHRPSMVVETGTHAGYSTSCIAAALKLLGGKRKLYSIDPMPLPQLWSGSEISPVIEQIRMRSQDAVPFVVSRLQGEPIDMLVLDSDHHYETIHSEFTLFEPMVRDGGLILLHDTIFFDGVGHLVNQVRQCDRFEVLTLDSPRRHDPPTARCPGITLIRKARSGAVWPPFDEAARGKFVGDPNSPAQVRQEPGAPAK
jgi:predicted O-methyltransferase YrrM